MQTEAEIVAALKQVLWHEPGAYARPSTADWKGFERLVGSTVPASFVGFINASADFHLPNEVLNVRETEPTNGNGTIEEVYLAEIKIGGWPPNLLPFLGTGNGDYTCLEKGKGEAAAVYYVYHEDRSIEKIAETFEQWLDSYLAELARDSIR